MNKKRSDRAKADAGAVDTRRPQVYSTHAQRESPSYRELQRNAERERERRRGKEREREKRRCRETQRDAETEGVAGLRDYALLRLVEAPHENADVGLADGGNGSGEACRVLAIDGTSLGPCHLSVPVARKTVATTIATSTRKHWVLSACCLVRWYGWALTVGCAVKSRNTSAHARRGRTRA